MTPPREDSDFDSAGVRCAAWLYRPEGEGSRSTSGSDAHSSSGHPCVVMAHGFSGVREQRLDAYAERFAAAGLAVLLFDYRHFGASDGHPRQLLSIRRQLADWRAAVAHARNLPDVDPRRVAVWGTSLSGGHVVAVAAKDPAIAAVVTQAPFTSGLAAIAAGGVPAALRLTRAGLRDGLAMALRREPSRIKVAGPPGSTAAMTTPEAVPGLAAIEPEGGSTWQDAVAGRVALTIGGYRPWAGFSKLRMPVFVAVCDNDTTTPPNPAVKAAERSPNAELVRYPIGHFEIYVDPQFETTVSDQTDFLVRNLVGGAVPVAG